MTTMDRVPTIPEVIAMKLAYFLRKRTQAEQAHISKRVRTRFESTIRVMLHLAAFACLTLAGFSWNITAGLLAAFVSCLTLSWLMTSKPQIDNDEPTWRP